jgi:glycosyltransferase involved in cell wall biosynthesis
MKILHIPRRFVKEKWGGTETVVLELAKAAADCDHEVEILCPAIFSAPGMEFMDNIRIRRFPYFYPYLGLGKVARQIFDNRGGNLFSFSLFKYLLTCPRPDIIHLHTGKRLGGIVRTVARLRKIPYFVSVHGGLYDVPEAEKTAYTEPAAGSWEWGKLLGFLFGSRRVFKDAAGIFCLGKKEAEFLRREYEPEKVHVLPNGVNTERFSFSVEARADFRRENGFGPDSFVILNVARIDPQKNQLVLVEMLHILRKEGVEAFLVLAGAVTDEGYERNLKATVSARGLDAFVRYMGSIEPHSELLPALYQGADMFLLPSVHEPFGIVILEAWASSLPVLAAAVGGVPDLITDDQNGLLFASGNQEQMLAQVRRMIGNGELRRKLAESALQKVRADYEWQNISQSLEKLYKRAIDENSFR